MRTMSLCSKHIHQQGLMFVQTHSYVMELVVLMENIFCVYFWFSKTKTRLLQNAYIRFEHNKSQIKRK